MSEGLKITLKVLEIVSPFLILLLTWYVGSRILDKYEIRKKKKEIDILIASEFYKLYGEFNSVWRVWKVHYDNYKHKSSLSGEALERYWELLKRASNVEGG